MLFFCPIDNAAPIRTTLAEQRDAIAPDGTRARQGLCVDAPNPAHASATLESYLLDCIRSGTPTYAPTVTIEDREGVPVATLDTFGPEPTAAEAAALATIRARTKPRQPSPLPGGSIRASTPPDGSARPSSAEPLADAPDAASGSAPQA